MKPCRFCRKPGGDVPTEIKLPGPRNARAIYRTGVNFVHQACLDEFERINAAGAERFRRENEELLAEMRKSIEEASA